MLCLTRRNGQSIQVGPVKFMVIKTKSGSVKFGIEAPRDMEITRNEIPPKQPDQKGT